MRGTLFLYIIGQTHVGITPAHAGNTPTQVIKRCFLRDHPRTCGEHACRLRVDVVASGSPPHMRGTLETFNVIALAVGITPAHAGNTPIAFLTFCTGRDHPRTCGEHKRSMAIERIPSGSPPHMRGTRHSFRNLTSMTGITPAHAGNTFRRCGCQKSPWDHPRTCGEHRTTTARSCPDVGSPPHMRGTHYNIDKKLLAPGITPAHAGNTWFPRRSTASRRDHPRTCGEHVHRS